VADLPQHLTLAKNRDCSERLELAARRVFFALLSALAAEARLQQITSFGEVQWAVLESGGRISFIPKSRS
jgi:hypothetical protein